MAADPASKLGDDFVPFDPIPLFSAQRLFRARNAEEQLRTILEFARRSVAVAAEEAARIRDFPKAAVAVDGNGLTVPTVGPTAASRLAMERSGFFGA